MGKYTPRVRPAFSTMVAIAFSLALVAVQTRAVPRKWVRRYPSEPLTAVEAALWERHRTTDIMALLGEVTSGQHIQALSTPSQDVPIILEAATDVSSSFADFSPRMKVDLLQQVAVLHAHGVPPDATFAVHRRSAGGLGVEAQPFARVGPNDLAHLQQGIASSWSSPSRGSSTGSRPPPTAPPLGGGGAATAVTETPPQPRPRGGMVWLRPGSLRFADDIDALRWDSIDDCDGHPCLSDGNSDPNGHRVALPFAFDRMFAEVWQLASQGDEVLYLSINPRKSTLAARMRGVPTRLADGSVRPLPRSQQRNDVVVFPEALRTMQVGRVLYDADVLFKSRALGFDVRTGMQLPALGGDDDDVESTRTMARWCRFYWSSGEVRLRVDGNTASFDGVPVVARAEPMRVEGSGNNIELVPAPEASGCRGAQRVARFLTEQVRTGTVDPRGEYAVVADLAKLAQMQSFARWFHQQGLTETPAFHNRLGQAHDTGPAPLPVPIVTSGVQAPTHREMQLEIDGNDHTLHIWSPGDDVEAMLTRPLPRSVRCPPYSPPSVDPSDALRFILDPALRCWAARDYTEGGELRPRDVWRQNAREFSAEFARAWGATLRPERNADGGNSSESYGRVAFAVHPTARFIHGGVMLGASDVLLDLERPQLRDPQGRPLLLQLADGLHAWRHRADAIVDLEHIVLGGLRVVASDARDRHVRLLLDRAGAEVPVVEYSLHSRGEVPHVWIQRRTLDGVPSSAQPGLLVGPCPPLGANMDGGTTAASDAASVTVPATAASSLCRTQVTEEDLQQWFTNDLLDHRALRFEVVGSGGPWVLDLDLDDLGEVLDDASPPSLGRVQQLRRLGFDREATLSLVALMLRDYRATAALDPVLARVLGAESLRDDLPIFARPSANDEERAMRLSMWAGDAGLLTEAQRVASRLLRARDPRSIGTAADLPEPRNPMSADRELAWRYALRDVYECTGRTAKLEETRRRIAGLEALLQLEGNDARRP